MSRKKNEKKIAPERYPDPSGFKIPYLALSLSAIILLVYSSSFTLGFTDLDDIIFINEQAPFNADIANLGHSFSRGVFHATEDTYYRPLLLNSFVLNAQISGTNIRGYHAVNILLHLIVVLMLLRLLILLQIPRRNAFLLCFLYAVHPVFVQAVSWVPGRNDTLLGIFTIAFFMSTVKYLQTHAPLRLAGAGVWLLAALFTKESALFVPAAAWILLLSMQRLRVFSKVSYYLYAVWIACALIWFAVRSSAGLANEGFSLTAMGANLIERTPVLVQYLGKAVLPFNQSVFPMMHDTGYLLGILALVIMAVLITFSDPPSRKIWIGGLGWFVILMLPVVMLPGTLNEQDFEHRLYVPFMGILIALAFSVALKGGQPVVTGAWVLVCIIFAALNIRHQQKFSDPVTFWEAAVQGTPHSGYATMMLAARLDDTDKPRADALMRQAYRLDPDEKYINFYMGKYYLDMNKPDSASLCLHRELELSAYYETYFQLSRLEFMLKDYAQSRSWMEKYLELNPKDAQAANNYILLLLQLNDKAAAKAFVEKKQREGMVFPGQLVDQLK